jgi:hypothetical protein
LLNTRFLVSFAEKAALHVQEPALRVINEPLGGVRLRVPAASGARGVGWWSVKSVGEARGRENGSRPGGGGCAKWNLGLYMNTAGTTRTTAREWDMCLHEKRQLESTASWIHKREKVSNAGKR